jgi:hypothetical protein
MAAASIEEVISPFRLNEGGKSMFSQTNPSAHRVFTDDGYFHKVPPVTWKFAWRMEPCGVGFAATPWGA